ncbi:MAG: phage tail protein [Candidatus Paraimprobicoccus trichonymphae]|uniref:Phage tail protein n=1 Tax=Candidatus Paraimprobicoccus trichonymphae TaxID=3033793 RepID=A0AA48L1G7_9FIRM|nr:MAG: phage tail protein [Candidatus Paraimprobicoccus trichonymphae]
MMIEKLMSFLQNYDKLRPSKRASAMDYVQQGCNFIVTFNLMYKYGFKEVSGIEVRKKYGTISEGGVNDHAILVGEAEGSELSLEFKRGMLIRDYSSSGINAASALAAALINNNLLRRTALVSLNSITPQTALENGPSFGEIEVYNRQVELVARYTFWSVGVTSWKLDELSAESANPLIEEFTIAHNGITREPISIPESLKLNNY